MPNKHATSFPIISTVSILVLLSKPTYSDSLSPLFHIQKKGYHRLVEDFVVPLNLIYVDRCIIKVKPINSLSNSISFIFNDFHSVLIEMLLQMFLTVCNCLDSWDKMYNNFPSIVVRIKNPISLFDNPYFLKGLSLMSLVFLNLDLANISISYSTNLVLLIKNYELISIV